MTDIDTANPLPTVRTMSDVQIVIALCNGSHPLHELERLLEPHVRAYLTHPDIAARLHVEGVTVSTTELGEALFPEQFARGELITRRKRLFNALLALAKGPLADCVSLGAPREWRGKTSRPKRWHPPRPLDFTERVAKQSGVSRAVAEAVIAAFIKESANG